MADSLQIDVNDRDVKKGLAKLRQAGQSMRPVFMRLKKPFRADVKDHQKRKEGPNGPWAERSQNTKRRDRYGKSTGKRRFKRRRKGRMLGKLPIAVSVKSNTAEFTGEAKIPWAAAHHDGAIVGKGTVLPARPFLFFSESFLQVAEEEIMNHLEEGWKQ